MRESRQGFKGGLDKIKQVDNYEGERKGCRQEWGKKMRVFQGPETTTGEGRRHGPMYKWLSGRKSLRRPKSQIGL